MKFKQHMIILVALMVGLNGTLAHAQRGDANAFNGKWDFQLNTPNGKRSGFFSINDRSGIWYANSQARMAPCLGREMPLKVTEVTQDQINFVVQSMEVVRGCRNLSIKLKVVGDGQLKGNMGSDEEGGAEVTATRQ